MAKYNVAISKTAEKQLDKLSDNVANPILNTIATLADNPRPHGYKKLKGRQGFRIRLGDYRIIYDIQDKSLIVEIIAVGNRRDIYD